MRDIEPPSCYSFVFNFFLMVYNNPSSQSGFTFQDIESLCNLRRIHLTQHELDLVMKCKNWANAEIKELKKE